MTKLKIVLLNIIVFTSVLNAQTVEWKTFKGIDIVEDRYIASGQDPFMNSNVFENPFKEGKEFLELTINSDVPVYAQLFWMMSETGEAEHADRQVLFAVPAKENFKYYIALNPSGRSKGIDKFRLDPTIEGDMNFTVETKFLTLEELPQKAINDLLKPQVYTSKLHYKRGERIKYEFAFYSKYYPELRSSKILEVEMLDSTGKVLATDLQHFGFDEEVSYKLLHGDFDFKKKLKPGQYQLKAKMTDQMTGVVLTSEHMFVVNGKKDAFVYETPFKFVKDYSLIQDHNGIFHIFSITGEFYKGHDWQPKGNERTFSHGTSKDLKNWTYHEPVLSISDRDYADGNEKYENRNIWAPHVIRKGDVYYMFYTSINNHVSQSISLATSKDLFNWTKHDKNPIVTLEGLDWADWGRDRWADFRDPMVLDDGNGKYYMYVTGTHKREGDTEIGSVTVLESEDLTNWKNPQSAVDFKHAMESPQVWKSKGKYYMTTSAAGHGQWESDNPVTGWKKSDFARPHLQSFEDRIELGAGSYAEEVIRLEDGTLIMGSLTWRHWGNSIYLFEVVEDKETGKPIGYKIP